MNIFVAHLTLFPVLIVSAMATQPKPIALNLLGQLQPGTSTKVTVRKLLGPPKTVTNLKHLPDAKQKGQLWEYFEMGQTRLTLSFSEDSEVLDSFTWHVYEGDLERDLKTTILKYPGTNWKVETVKWVNPHHMPNECYFNDNATGLSIEYNRSRQKVSSISRWNPMRKPATDSKEKPPKFCIDKSCSDGIPSKDLFKDEPLCQIPK